MHVILDTAGNSAELREVADLRRPERVAVNKAIAFTSDPETGTAIVRASMEDDMATALLPLVIVNWSLPLPIPAKSVKSLDELTLEQDDALREAIAPHLEAIQGANAPVKDNADPTPDSASTGASSAE